MSAPFSRGMLQKIWKCLNGAGCFVFRTRVIREVREWQIRFFYYSTIPYLLQPLFREFRS